MNKRIKQSLAALGSVALTGSAFAADPTSLASAVSGVDLTDAKTGGYIGIGLLLGVAAVFYGGRKVVSLFGR